MTSSSVPVASGTPTPFWRRTFDWWLMQVKHLLPPTIFLKHIGMRLCRCTTLMPALVLGGIAGSKGNTECARRDSRCYLHGAYGQIYVNRFGNE